MEPRYGHLALESTAYPLETTSTSAYVWVHEEDCTGSLAKRKRKMKQVSIPPMCIVSGPEEKKNLCVQALARAGLTVLIPHNHGLPSYSDPLTAAAAGAPNSGHTPGTFHPATLLFHNGDGEPEERENPLSEHVGSEYENDPTISFLAVPCDDPDRVSALAAEADWVLRMHTAAVLHHEEEEMSVEDRLKRAEADLEIVRKSR